MTLRIHLLGPPHLERPGSTTYQFRSRKSWAVLACLLLSDAPPTRGQLASLLYDDADDPLRALRWNLTEIRRALGEGGCLEGDPLRLELPPGTVVDTDVVTSGSWPDALDLPGLGRELVEGVAVRGAPVFDTWLVATRRRLTAASEAMLHEAAQGLLSRGEPARAIDLAVRAAALNPLEEAHHALLVRLYRELGDDTAAERQFAVCAELLERELGVAPGPAVRAALHTRRHTAGASIDRASISALVEAGSAAVSAGANEAGIDSLRTAAGLADEARETELRVSARLVLAEALVHSLGGMDEEGQAILHEADRIAMAHGDLESVARARSEVGYVDFLRARYDRAEHWLGEALRHGREHPRVTSRATTYLGCVASDRAHYGRAVELLEQGRELAREANQPRTEAYALAMLGRVALLRGDLDPAAEWLAASLTAAEREHWLSFLPWPQALLGSVALERGDLNRSSELLQQAFARACSLGDPCWEGLAALGLARLAAARGEVPQAFELLADARQRATRMADSYAWLDVYALDALCSLAVRHGNDDAPAWVALMRERASRTGMRELTVRSLLHAARLGDDDAADAARLLGADIDSPALAALVADGS